jgi:hypothetical protein
MFVCKCVLLPPGDNTIAVNKYIIYISDNSRRVNHDTHFMFNKFFIPENRPCCEIMLEKCGTARQTTDDSITRRMRFACWLTKATEAQSACGLLTALTQQRLR